MSHLLKVKIAAASLLSSHSHKNFSCGQPQTRPYREGDSGKHSSSLARLTQYKILQGLRLLTPVFLSPPDPVFLSSHIDANGYQNWVVDSDSRANLLIVLVENLAPGFGMWGS